MTKEEHTTKPGRIVKTLAKLLGLELSTAPEGTTTARRDLPGGCRIVFSDLCDDDGSIRVDRVFADGRITAGLTIPIGDVAGID